MLFKISLRQSFLFFLVGFTCGFSILWIHRKPVVQIKAHRVATHSGGKRHRAGNITEPIGIPATDHAPIPTVLSRLRVMNSSNLTQTNIKILAWIMTNPITLYDRGLMVNSTWGRRVDKLLFVSDRPDTNFSSVVNITVKFGREYLSEKTMLAFDHVFHNYLHDYDWFLKADDDTYVIVENLRYFLSDKDPSSAVYYGYRFDLSPNKKNPGYHSGGAGYVLSREALRRFGVRRPSAYNHRAAYEDMEMARCLNQLGVRVKMAEDNQGRTLFHCFHIFDHISPPSDSWIQTYNRLHGGKIVGLEHISPYAATFHYAKPEEMRLMELLLYKFTIINKAYRDETVNRTQNILPR